MSRGILAAIDFSSITDQVLIEASRLAKAMQLPLSLLYAAAEGAEPGFDGLDESYPGRSEIGLDRLRKQLEGHRKRLASEGLEVGAMVVSGTPVKVILREAERLEAEFLVLGSHGHGAFRCLLTGSVCLGVLRDAARPVVIVPRKMAPAQRVCAETEAFAQDTPVAESDLFFDLQRMMSVAPASSPLKKCVSTGRQS